MNISVKKDALEDENSLLKHEELYQYYQSSVQNNNFLHAELDQTKTEKKDLQTELDKIKREKSELESGLKKRCKKKNNQNKAKEKYKFADLNKEVPESEENYDFEPTIPVKNRFEGLNILTSQSSDTSNLYTNSNNNIVAPVKYITGINDKVLTQPHSLVLPHLPGLIQAPQTSKISSITRPSASSSILKVSNASTSQKNVTAKTPPKT